MQAIILAAGMGTRIPQYTQDMPKCMIQINGKPILEHTVQALRECGVSTIAIGLGYKAHVIRDFIAVVPTRLEVTSAAMLMRSPWIIPPVAAFTIPDAISAPP